MTKLNGKKILVITIAGVIGGVLVGLFCAGFLTIRRPPHGTIKGWVHFVMIGGITGGLLCLELAITRRMIAKLWLWWFTGGAVIFGLLYLFLTIYILWLGGEAIMSLVFAALPVFILTKKLQWPFPLFLILSNLTYVAIGGLIGIILGSCLRALNNLRKKTKWFMRGAIILGAAHLIVYIYMMIVYPSRLVLIEFFVGRIAEISIVSKNTFLKLCYLTLGTLVYAIIGAVTGGLAGLILEAIHRKNDL